MSTAEVQENAAGHGDRTGGKCNRLVRLRDCPRAEPLPLVEAIWYGRDWLASRKFIHRSLLKIGRSGGCMPVGSGNRLSQAELYILSSYIIKHQLTQY